MLRPEKLIRLLTRQFDFCHWSDELTPASTPTRALVHHESDIIHHNNVSGSDMDFCNSTNLFLRRLALGMLSVRSAAISYCVMPALSLAE